VNSKFEAVMESMVDPSGPGAAIGVRQGNHAPYVAGFGLADVEWDATITPDTVFRIGSITKQFTAAAIMLLAEEGKLGLDDTIQSVLGDYPAPERPVTIRHLLNHTSGIERGHRAVQVPAARLQSGRACRLFEFGLHPSWRHHRSVVRNGVQDVPARAVLPTAAHAADSLSLRRTDRGQTRERLCGRR